MIMPCASLESVDITIDGREICRPGKCIARNGRDRAIMMRILLWPARHRRTYPGTFVRRHVSMSQPSTGHFRGGPTPEQCQWKPDEEDEDGTTDENRLPWKTGCDHQIQ